MLLQSLHSKIFVLVTTILAAVAIAVMLTSQRNVTHTVMTSEHHAIHNVLQLIQHDAASRWSAMLNNKASIVRHGRRQLMQSSQVIQATLASYVQLADDGVLTQTQAQDLARNWINHLQLDDSRYAFVFNKQYVVLASGNEAMRGIDLSPINDYKERPLAKSALEESRDSGDSFAIYRKPTAPPLSKQTDPTHALLDEHDANSRYAYFVYFHPWDWVLAVSDSATDIIDQIHDYRMQMERSVRETLLPLQLVHSGFVFIMKGSRGFVVPPPAAHADLLDGLDREGRTLHQRLTNLPHTGLHSWLETDAGDLWQIEGTYYAPLRWTIVAAVPQKDLIAPAQKLLRSQVLIFTAMLLVASLCAWFFAARLVRPLKRLTSFVRKLPDHALRADHHIPRDIIALPDTHKDEVGRLAQAFLDMDEKLRNNIHQLMIEATTRERIESDLSIAREIQQGLLPTPLPEDTPPLIDLHALMRPAKAVGGDLYDYFYLPDGKLCIAIGDVSDKGVPAALFMAVTRTLIRSVAEDETDPAHIVYKINDRLAQRNPNMMFVTLLLGVLDVKTGEFAWVNAGHLEPFIVDTHGTVRLLHGRSGPACGVQERVTYRTHCTQLQHGDTLLGYTDGITEGLNPSGEQYADARLLAILAQPSLSAAALAERLLADVDTFAHHAEQADDITLLVVRRL